MEKLKLQIESLRVDRFETEPSSAQPRGTVQALSTQGPDTCVCGVGPSEPHRFCVEMPITHSCDFPC